VVAPDFYELDEEGFNVLRDRPEMTVPRELEDEARVGCDACPEGAITLTEE
jgi:ferredoxin